MSKSDDARSRTEIPRGGFRSGEPVRVWLMGTWQPGLVLGTDDSGRVLVRFRGLDGGMEERAFPSSAVVDGDRC